MKRLPKGFEEEVLSKYLKEKYCNRFHIKYNDKLEGFYYAIHEDNIHDDYLFTDYEIAAIALEAMECVYMAIPEGHQVFYGEDEPITDKDFCTCIFKAISEVYK